MRKRHELAAGEVVPGYKTLFAASFSGGWRGGQFTLHYFHENFRAVLPGKDSRTV